MTVRKSRVPRTAGIALTGALVGSGLVGCATETTVQEDVYCTTDDGVIVDEDYCDADSNSGGGYFIYYGSFGSDHRPGDRLTGGNRFAYNDQAKRSELGLPKTGKITSGKGGFGTTVSRTVTKGGGFGGGSGHGGG